ncbi:F-box/LRR-repeat protein 2-like [Aphidius gifuensis]|uniref:F-box/LRR-repeat protein 2-like n=1 Tax=Aphidius gifuensis TaxID=684658 RepID=UPI001CDD3106|nr:F-box/LRR-repeat protein 2-like [Aphidius gifuensis]
MSAKKIRRFEEQQPSDNVEEKKNPIDILDYDSLSQIFMQLTISERMVMEKVCCKWKEACKLACYLKITCRNANEGLAESALQKLTELKNLEYLILPDGLKLSGETIMTISNNCKKLKHLEMTNCTINTVSALDEISKLQHLEYLNLSDAKDFNEFIVRLKRFKSLNFHSCKNITDDGIVQLIKNCPDLEDLNLRLSDITFSMILEANHESRNPINNIISFLKIIEF